MSDTAVERMRRLSLSSDGDPESSHSEADEILLEVLRGLGHHRLCEYFERVPKWYA